MKFFCKNIPSAVWVWCFLFFPSPSTKKITAWLSVHLSSPAFLHRKSLPKRMLWMVCGRSCSRLGEKSVWLAFIAVNSWNIRFCVRHHLYSRSLFFNILEHISPICKLSFFYPYNRNESRLPRLVLLFSINILSNGLLIKPGPEFFTFHWRVVFSASIPIYFPGIYYSSETLRVADGES